MTKKEKKYLDLQKQGYVPAYQSKSHINLKDNKYCRFCEMIWYKCFCSHDDK